MASRVDLSAAVARQTAQTNLRDHARSTVLSRFDAADARRQFSLDQAAESRADQAARGSAEPRDEKSDRAATSDRTIAARAPLQPESSAGSRPRTASTHQPAASAKSTTGRPAAEKPAAKWTAEKAPVAEAAGETAADEAAGPTSAAASEAPPEATAASPAAALPTLGAQPSVSSNSTPSAASEEDDTSTHVGSAASPSGAIADAGPGAAAADGARPAAPGATFSALLDSVAEPSPTVAPSPTTTAAASSPKSLEAPSALPTAQASAPPVPLGAVPMTIALRSLQDASRFEIRLDPYDLGRIDVTLDIDKNAGTVSADLVVDRPETLALLQRDAGALQQALQQAGLDASAGVSLSLRDGGASGGQGDGSTGDRPGTARGKPQPDTADITDPTPLRALRLSGIDIRI